jgi:hypothetical protein
MESVLHDPTMKIVLESELAKRSIGLISTSINLRVVERWQDASRTWDNGERDSGGLFGISRHLKGGLFRRMER